MDRCEGCDKKLSRIDDLKERIQELEEENDRLKAMRHPSGCDGCYEKQRELDLMKEENQTLKAKLRIEERKSQEGFFGSSTPSSKIPVKANSPPEQKKNGGARLGHRGHGRKPVLPEEADRIEPVPVDHHCPACGEELLHKGVEDRSVVECVPIQVQKIIYRCEKRWCPRCRKTIQGKPPVLPRAMYGNRLIAQVATWHYEHGIPEGRVEAMLGVGMGSGSLFEILHRVSRLWEPAIGRLTLDFRKEPVKHGDETGWRTDGHSGYAWNFCSPSISLFHFKDSRSAVTPQSVLGTRKLSGVLVVDRYAGYNKAPCKIQYCWVHLKRDVEDLGKEFPDAPEVQRFVDALTPLMSEVIHLRITPISNIVYYKKAKALKRKVLKIVHAPASHLGIQNIQFIFKKHAGRLYHWVSDRNVPADNNRAERELRPTVIARKVSLGSQSEQGAKTRSVWMTILHTAKKRLKNQTVVNWLKNALDQIVANPNIDPYSLLPPSASDQPRRRLPRTSHPP